VCVHMYIHTHVIRNGDSACGNVRACIVSVLMCVRERGRESVRVCIYPCTHMSLEKAISRVVM